MKIEKGIPMPNAEGKYPFKQMDVGDSFAVKVEDKRTSSRVSTYAHYAGKRLGMKFTVRTIDKKIVRVWRIA
jgi:hypothetical protein